MTPLQVLFCPDCAADQFFEQPCCPDGHGADCPELTCLECGSAVLVGSLAEELARISTFPVRRAA